MPAHFDPNIALRQALDAGMPMVRVEYERQPFYRHSPLHCCQESMPDVYMLEFHL